MGKDSCFCYFAVLPNKIMCSQMTGIDVQTGVAAEISGAWGEMGRAWTLLEQNEHKMKDLFELESCVIWWETEVNEYSQSPYLDLGSR